MKLSRETGHVPTEMVFPKPLAQRLISECCMIKTNPEQIVFPDGDFKLALPSGYLKIRINK